MFILFYGPQGSYSYTRSTQWPDSKFGLLLQGNLNFEIQFNNYFYLFNKNKYS